ncbi:MAG: peptidoglycan DD-metalloendopeptidase family protein [Clostridiales bacterium]|jgi:murein DD-endopeptidase MepM/ murein hydrolase activator NlpD|nr:peptidoglycan DD-metalloendopeptidase family protein [Clostridiales bacterium]
MRKFLTAFLLIIITLGFTADTIAETLDDLTNRRVKVNAQQVETENLLEDTKAQKTQTELDMRSIDDELTATTDALLYTEERLSSADEALLSAEEELKAAENVRDEQYELLKTRLRFMYMNGSVGYLDIIFGATSFTDFFNRVEYINRIAEHDQTLVDKLTVAEENVNDKINRLDQRKESFELLKHEQERHTLELRQTMIRKQELYDRLDSDEKSYQEKLNALDATEKEIKELIVKKQQEAVSDVAGGYASATTNISPYDGDMAWPVPGRYSLSDTYRQRINPVNGRREFHSGLDIPAPTGTSIVAAEDGVVITSGWKNGYGNTIIIDHGNGISTLYGHNSRLTVNVGQAVSKGQEISKCGSTGQSTGPHCHFEVRINGNTVNPNSYVY